MFTFQLSTLEIISKHYCFQINIVLKVMKIIIFYEGVCMIIAFRKNIFESTEFIRLPGDLKN